MIKEIKMKIEILHDDSDRKYGYLIYNGVEITLKQDPYCDTYFGDGNQRPAYFAKGEGDDGHDYCLMWEMIHDVEDESECCNWEEFTVRKY